ncbi:MAG: DUF362 domain-containing protein [Anaerolineales bacterium]|nr:DUF362 domain-containing protein [Anaerolineales bacterium]
MTELNRREFLCYLLKGVSFLGVNALVGGCQPGTDLYPKSIPSSKEKLGTPEPTLTPNLTPNSVEPGAAAAPTSTRVSSPTPTVRPPDLVVTRHGSPQRLVKKAIKALGGMGQFVRPGDDVIIKPNICVSYHSYEYAATTNPWVVATLVELALGYDARRVRVMDNPFGGTAQQAYLRSGIQKEVERVGGEMEVMAPYKYVNATIPGGKVLKQCQIYQDVLQADVLINVPLVKHHGLAKMTLGMKNMLGVISNRPAMHQNLGQKLADLNSRVRSHLVVVDAVRMLMNHGPSGGNLSDVKKADTLIAARDIVAADSYAATLFGLKPNNLDFVRAGSALGLGRSDLDNLKIEELDVS